MVKTWKRDDLTVLCRNASPKYCAPWSPISLHHKLSVVSVCMKETGMNEWRRRWWSVAYSDKGWVSACTSVLLVRQESNASDLTGKCTEWMCKLYGGVSGKYRCAWWVPSRECVSEDVSFLRTAREFVDVGWMNFDCWVIWLLLKCCAVLYIQVLRIDASA